VAKSDLMTRVLIQIRDETRANREEIKRTNEEIKRTNEELHKTRVELSSRIERLEKRQVESKVRLAAELTAVIGAITELSKLVAEDRQLRTQVQDHEKRLGKLERKTG
jgi:hypothetical protein